MGVKTGYTDLDDMLMALRPGSLYVSRRPGVGKTSFSLSLVENISKAANEDESAERQGVLLFSLEVDRVDLVRKLLCSAASIDFRKLERGMIEDAEWEALAAAAQDFKQWQLDLMDVSDLTVQALRSVVKRHPG